MALSTTTLGAAVTVSDAFIKVASATSFTANDLIIIDQELLQVTKTYGTAPYTSTIIPVLRGRNGTITAAHVVTANVTRGLASDFASPGGFTDVTYPSVRATQIVSVTATSTLTLPAAGEDMRVILNGTGAITLTIPVPTKDMDGCKLEIVSNGAAAHVPTFTGGVGGAGSSYDAFTFNSTGTLAIEAIACNGLWCMKAATPIAGTVTNITATIG
jgi:hypothetical protein